MIGGVNPALRGEASILIEYFSITVSITALVLSAITMWFTLLHRGRLKMTKPMVVFFGYDFVPKATPKIFLRTLLFSTATQGIVIESMYVKVSNNEKIETFSFWGYGETNNLVPGSGLFVGKTGISFNHHFVWSVDRPAYKFEVGDYQIDVYATIIGRVGVQKLSTIDIHLSAEHVSALSKQDGVLFEFMPETQNYVGRSNKRSTQ